MADYSKALLSEDVEYRCREVPAERQRVMALALLSVFIDAAVSLALLSLSVPFSLPLWPLFGAIFISAFYAFRRSNPTALRPLLILLMLALVVGPSLFVVLIVSFVRDPSYAVQLLSAFLPFIPPHFSPLSALLPVCFVLLCSVMSFYWQLHIFWQCQEKFEQTKRWDSPTAKGYAELLVPDPFLIGGRAVDEKQPLKQKQRRRKEAAEGADEKSSSVSTRVTLPEVMPDYQVFSLNEDEPMKQSKGEAREDQQRTQKRHEETDGRIRGSG